ncbi:MAG: hypothetical protein AAF940_13155 [Pseudomonadota bacterium]
MNSFFASLVGETLAPWLTGFVVLLLIVMALWVMVAMIGRYRHSVFVSGGRKNRLQVVDATAIDDRRRLVLVRRDDVEHLVMIGGHNDLVVEKDIAAQPQTAPEAVMARKPAPAAPSKAPEMGRKLPNLLRARNSKPKTEPKPQPTPTSTPTIDEGPAAAKPAAPSATPIATPAAMAATSAAITATPVTAKSLADEPVPEKLDPTGPKDAGDPPAVPASFEAPPKPQDLPKMEPAAASPLETAQSGDQTAPTAMTAVEPEKPQDPVEALNFDDALADITIEAPVEPATEVKAPEAAPAAEKEPAPEDMKEKAKSLEGEMEKLLSELTVQR